MATSERESELKQQGAIEAAQDPESSVTAEDVERKLLEESKKAGVVAVAFDPDASPEEKKEKAREVGCEHCPEIPHRNRSLTPN